MKRAEYIACIDQDLEIEAYHFQGVMQKFPNHFHEYYVIGFLESGSRQLLCKKEEYNVCGGDLLLFNPMDTHTCTPKIGLPFDYKFVNIKPEIMKKAVLEITGEEYLPSFSQTVILNSEIIILLRELHQAIMERQVDFEKKELFLFLIEQLLEKYGQNSEQKSSTQNLEIEYICNYIEQHYMQRISLDDLSKLTQINKYSLVRHFAKIKGITPYCYLETVRVNAAKQLLEKQIEPIDVAMQVGFVDQSHLTNHFKKFTGLTPKQYQNIFISKDKSYPLDRRRDEN